LTAHAMSSDLDLCIEAGCNAYATKPIEKAKLIEVCRHWGHKLPAPEELVSSEPEVHS